MPTEPRPPFTIRRANRREAGLFRDWAAVEGWNPGPDDAACFFETDPNGFFLGELDGVPVACISCVAYGDAFGFVGHYIVKPGFRGRGFGLQVWNAGMEYLVCRNVGLDGVLAQQDNYRKSGFRFAYNNVRYRAVGGGEAVGGVIPLSSVPFMELVAYDRPHFPADRADFLRRWVSLPGVTGLAVRHGEALAGYGVLRPVFEGFKIGPLFAGDPRSADQLFRGLLACAAGRPVFLDAPDDTANSHAGELARRYGLPEVFRTARMYTGDPPPIRLGQVYGVTSFELG